MRRFANGLFVAATFTSAFVLFVMQPFAARALLPRYGGAPHVWVTTAVFFQVAVLLADAGALAPPPAPSWRVQARWIALSFVPSLLLFRLT